jgi:hypothetical protein
MEISILSLSKSPSFYYSVTTTLAHHLTEWRNPTEPCFFCSESENTLKKFSAEIGYSILILVGVVECAVKTAFLLISIPFCCIPGLEDRCAEIQSDLGDGLYISFKGLIGSFDCLTLNMQEETINFPVLLFNAFHEENCYSALNIDCTANQDAINRAYRSLSRKFHPDKNPIELFAAGERQRIATSLNLSSEELKEKYSRIFTEISKAHEILQSREELGFGGLSVVLYCLDNTVNDQEIREVLAASTEDSIVQGNPRDHHHRNMLETVLSAIRPTRNQALI